MSRAPRIFALTPAGHDLLRKGIGAHKYDHGHALVMTGGTGRTGAARLAARGALRIGAGLVTLAVPPDAMAEVAGHVTAIMLREAGDAPQLVALLEDHRFNALCLGPGLGLAPQHADLVATMLAAQRPTVLDADALTLLGDDAGLMAALHPACVLTPHEGEFRRLFPDLAVGLDAPTAQRAAMVQKAAARAGCTVLLKGAETLVACPEGSVTRHSPAEDGALAWLATAGSGDVLAGFILGLLARRVATPQAANLAVWLHRQAARQFGPGLIAEDLPEELPAVFRAIGV
jgi:hydroxyethylthiazole kinase-like uncharacterized protein yjeF